MINIAICDDDSYYLGVLETRAREYFQRMNLEVKITLFANGADFWNSFIAEPFQIAILDIMLPDQTGIDLARKIFYRDRNCVIAFLTSSPDFAVQGYGVNAVGYVLKPAGDEELAELFGKCLFRYYETRPAHIIVKSGGANQRIEMSSIVYLESKNKQVLVNMGETTLAFSGKLSEVMEQLPPYFVQTHKSYVVNLARVASMTRDDMATEDGVRIPVSRQYYKNASQRYLDHVAREV